MNIRDARVDDAAKISDLLEQLGYVMPTALVKDKLLRLAHHPDALLITAVDDKDELVGFISAHFIPQIGVVGDFCRISYFCVDRLSRSASVGKCLEERLVEVAKKRGCDRIEVHCHSRRHHAHHFYARQGYSESPKYLLKLLTNPLSTV